MTVKCEAMVDAASTPRAPESKQALVVDDSSAKTIEFLRARLLAERAASKAARQEAQEIAEKVKDLHARLETEIEQRKEAEAAMERVFAILKAKGLAVDGLVLASADLKDKSESGVSPLSDVKEVSEDHESPPCHILEPPINEEVPPMPLENKDESTEKSTVAMEETRINVTNESHSSNAEDGILSMVVNTGETCRDTQDAFPCNACDLVLRIDRTESGKDFSLRNDAEGHHCQVDDDRVQRTVINKQVVHTDHSSPNCSPECKKDSPTDRTIDQGLSITLKLKAMLHQIEEEVGALPKEQPLKYKLQGWMDHVASVLDKGEEAGINGGLEVHSLDDNNKVGTNYPLKGTTDVETKSVVHTEMPILLTKKGHADALHVDETGITEEVDTKEELDKSLSIVPKDMLPRPNLLPSSNNYNGEYPSTMYPPTRIDPVWHANMSHNRNPSCESLNGSNRAAYVLQDPPKRPLHPLMMQHVISHSSIANPPMFANGHTSNGHYIGSESSYLVEAQSPRSSDVISVGDAAGKVGYVHGQWNEAWYQGRVLGSKRQAGYREDPLKFQSEGAWSQDRYFNHGNIQYERGPAISHSTFMHVRDAREFAMKSTARHPKGGSLSDATLSLVDDRNGRLGDILMALDAARQHVNDDVQSLYGEEQLIGPPTQTVADARLHRGYRQYGDEVQQVPCEYRNHAWRSRAHSQAPIIHFPPSPTSEHGYSPSPFERHGGHRRSSSVATNFIMSEWESYPQTRGEVELGNGITLYTD